MKAFALFALASLALAVALPGTSARAGSAAGNSPHTPGFAKGTVTTAIEQPTSLAFGPDGRLYVASTSSITALTLDPFTNHVTASETIASNLDFVLGIAFDPTAPASPVVIYASRQEESATDGFEGVISKFTGPGWTRTDVITGLPTSAPMLNHLTNGIAFDSEGRLLIAQGSSTDAGISDPPGNTIYWPETPLSAAILVAAIHAAEFDGNITYSPSGPPQDDNVDQTGGDVAVLASGLRNPYDLVVHSNGRVYATDNAPLGGVYSSTCVDSSGPSSTVDELNLIELGKYYGAPNRNRGRTDSRQCTYHAPEESSGTDFTGPIALLPAHCSCDGIAEYSSDAFGGSMQGDLVYAEYIRGFVSRADLSADGTSVTSTNQIGADFDGPLDVAVGADGTIYVAEFDGGRISFLAPDEDGDACADTRELGPDESLGGRRSPGNPWDFYDINGDGSVSLGNDILPVLAGFGPSSGPDYETLLDRAQPPSAATQPDAALREPWDTGPPDGTINALDDAYAAVRQFGHTCRG